MATMTYKRVNFSLHPKTIKLLSEISKKEHRNKSNMIEFLIHGWKEISELYYCKKSNGKTVIVKKRQ